MLIRPEPALKGAAFYWRVRLPNALPPITHIPSDAKQYQSAPHASLHAGVAWAFVR